MKLLFMLLAALTLLACDGSRPSDPDGPTQAPDDAAPQGTGSLDIFTWLDSEAAPDENVVFSPVSAMQAMGLVQLGARSDTARQIETVLDIGPGEAGAADLKQVRDALIRDTQGATVGIANALFLADDYRFAPAYIDSASRLFAAKTQRVSFSKRPGEAVAAINGWAEEATDGLVPRIVDQATLNRDAAAYLTNATFFEAEWRTAFRGGRMAPFLFGDGSERDFFLMEGRLSVPYSDEHGWRAVRLPYGASQGGQEARFVMDVMMPRGRGARTPALGGKVLADIAADLGKAAARHVLVEMPRFEADMRRDLIAPLRALGVTLPFDRNRADLTAMSAPGSARLYIEEAFQVAKVQVHERGTRAAAVTVVVPVPVSVPPPFDGIAFTVDRPFVFAIRDLATDTVLFVGRIASPVPYEAANADPGTHQGQ